MKGTVKWYNTMKGFGFIEGENKTDYFFHCSQIKEGVKINEKDRVEFETEIGDRGERAINVKKMEAEDGN